MIHVNLHFIELRPKLFLKFTRIVKRLLLPVLNLWTLNLPTFLNVYIKNISFFFPKYEFQNQIICTPLKPIIDLKPLSIISPGFKPKNWRFFSFRKLSVILTEVKNKVKSIKAAAYNGWHTVHMIKLTIWRHFLVSLLRLCINLTKNNLYYVNDKWNNSMSRHIILQFPDINIKMNASWLLSYQLAT